RARFPSTAISVEDWLIDVANARGAQVVSREMSHDGGFKAPGESVFSTEELVTALCLSSLPDRLQSLRLAAQFISRGTLDREEFLQLTIRERTGQVLHGLAESALRVNPQHELWLWVHQVTGIGPGKTTPPLLHWSRLAFPEPDHRHIASGRWKLVS
ncbi:MAG: hypothetical protein KDL10_06520, partial [Kiritimatiellae bacterium]|nr:hypothetical protein [Kiritimatiellia bacterium]